MLETEKFSTTFGPKAQRKRPKLTIGDVDEMVSKVDDSLGIAPSKSYLILPR